MLSNLRMRAKLLLTLLPLIVLLYLSTVLMVYHSSKASTEALAQVAVRALAEREAALLSADFEQVLEPLRNTAKLFASEMIDNQLPDRRIADLLLEPFLQDRQQIDGLWWWPLQYPEQSALWLREQGRAVSASAVTRTQFMQSLERPRQGEEQIIPLIHLPDSLQTRVIVVQVPVLKDGAVLGFLGVGFNAARIQQVVSAIRPFEVGVAALVAADTTLIAHPDPSRIGRFESETEADFLGEYLDEAVAAVRRGQALTLKFNSPALGNEETFMLVTPVSLAQGTVPWSLGLAFASSALLGELNALALQLLFMALVALLLISGLIWYLGAQLAKPLDRAVLRVAELASGEADLTQRLAVNGRDEVGVLSATLNQFLDTLSALVATIEQSGGRLDCAAAGLQTHSAQATGSVDLQRDQISQVNLAMQQMVQTVETLAEQAAKAAAQALEGDQSVQEGQHAVRELVLAIAEDEKVLVKVQSLTEQLEHASQVIGQLVGVIGDIANQTNLLALNAAIESARAGEMGRGFAVVADEVRALANRTQSSTEKVCESVAAIQERTQEVVQMVGMSLCSAQHNVTRAEHAQAALAQLAQLSSGMREMGEHIASATHEQAATTEQLSNSLMQLAEGAQASSEHVLSVRGQSDELALTASELNALVARFRH